MTVETHRLYIGIPADEDGAEVLATVARALSEAYGGATVIQARGAWIAPDGVLTWDNAVVVETVDTAGAGVTVARDVARYAARALRQQCVMVSTAPVRAVEFVEPVEGEAV